MFLASMTLLSIVGRKHLTVHLKKDVAQRPLFQLLVVFAIVYINTRSFLASVMIAVFVHFLGKIDMFESSTSASSKESFEEPQLAQRTRGPKRGCCQTCGK